MSGRTADLIGKYRPPCPVLLVTSNVSVARTLQLRRGVHACLVPPDLSFAEVLYDYIWFLRVATFA